MSQLNAVNDEPETPAKMEIQMRRNVPIVHTLCVRLRSSATSAACRSNEQFVLRV